jgi:hypothetical protein
MTPEPPRATRPEPNTSALDERGRAIEWLYQLLSSGRPLSEVLDEAKRLAVSNALSNPTPATVSEHNATPVERLKAVLSARAQQQNDRRFRLPQLSFRIPSWLTPAIGAAALAVAAATALLVNLRQADAIYVVPTLIEKPAVEPTEAGPAEPQSINIAQKPNASKAAQLLAGGDVFMSRGDVRSARQLYERAVDLGDVQAALRLGASYDPTFLSRAGIQGVPGDPVNAAYWHKRARDLGAGSNTETLLRGINIEEGNQRRKLAMDVNRNAPARSPAAPHQDPGAVEICQLPHRMTERDGCR